MLYHQKLINILLQEIVMAEKAKQSISREILLHKANNRELLIYSFLSYELDKHEMFEDLAKIAFAYSEDSMLHKLENYYRFSEGENLMARIRTEISTSMYLIQLIGKEIKRHKELNFTERRCLKEVNQYVLAQARYYCNKS